MTASWLPSNKNLSRGKVIERWIFTWRRNNDDNQGMGFGGMAASASGPSSAKMRQDQTVLRKLCIGIRSLLCYSRILPGYELFRRRRVPIECDVYFMP